MKLLSLLVATALAICVCGDALFEQDTQLRIGPDPEPERPTRLQYFVTWDEHSLFIKGERAMIFSGEVHPFRLPVPSLWLDVFQKIKALGFNCVSFYTMWALLEGKQGSFRAEGVFDLKPFFEAALEAGVYLIAVGCSILPQAPGLN